MMYSKVSVIANDLSGVPELYHPEEKYAMYTLYTNVRKKS